MIRSPGRLSRRDLLATSLVGLSSTYALAANRIDGGSTHERGIVIDGNAVPPITGPGPLPAPIVAAIRASRLTAMKATLDGDETYQGVTAFLSQAFPAVMAANTAILMPIVNAADIAAATQAGKLGIIRSFEKVGQLAGDPANIDHFAALGVRVMQLSYNDRSPFAGGALDKSATGLTDLGRQAVARMNGSGVTIDMSHLDTRSAFDVIAASKRPAVFTHAGCAALHAHPRNKPDDLLARMAKAGGVVGIYDLPFLVAPPKQPNTDDYLAHLVHALTVCGEDHVGIGSDDLFMGTDLSPAGVARAKADMAERKTRGIAAPEEDRLPYVVGMNGPSRYEVIADGLARRRYRAAAIDKVLGGNWLRVFEETWTVAS